MTNGIGLARRSASILAAAALGALGLSAEGAAQPAPAEAADLIPYPVHESTLGNGLGVIAIPMPSEGLATFWSIVRTGSRDEYEPGRTGFAHFFEHMMFRGTEKYPPDVYQRMLTEIGADANAFTSNDLTAFHVSATAADLERIMDLESDRFMHLDYSEQAFETEAGAVYGEYRTDRTNPLFVLYEAVTAAAFERHTYGHTTMGYERDIAAMPTMFDYSLSFFDRYYRPENTILLVVGDIDPAEVVRLAEKYYADWQPGYVAPSVPVEPEQHEPRRVEVAYDGQSLPIVWVAYKLDAFDPGNRRRVAADLLAELAFGPTSEAYQRLVIDEQVVESMQADANLSRDPELFDVYMRVKDPARVDYVLDVIGETVDGFKHGEPDARRLADLKSHLRYGFVMGLSTPDGVAGRLAPYIAIGGGLGGVRDLYAAYAHVGADDIRDAAEHYFDERHRTIGVLGARQ
jgi:zinc protease